MFGSPNFGLFRSVFFIAGDSSAQARRRIPGRMSSITLQTAWSAGGAWPTAKTRRTSISASDRNRRTPSGE
jgi:hypothetical protein